LAAEVNIGDGKGSSAVRPPYVVTPIEGIYKRAKNASVIMDPWCADAAAVMMIWYPGMKVGFSRKRNEQSWLR